MITVKSKAEAVSQAAECSRRLLDLAASADVHEAIRQGLEDVERGRTQPAREAFAAIRHRHGISH